MLRPKESIVNLGLEYPNYSLFYRGVYQFPVGAADFQNGCTKFNGINSEAYAGPVEPTDALGTAFTLEFWIKPERVMDERTLPEVLFSKGDANPGSWDCDFFVSIDTDSKISATLATTTTEADTTAVCTETLYVNVWYLVQIVFKETSITFYIDGNLVNTVTVSNTDWGNLFDATKNFRIGATEPALMAGNY